MPIHTDATAKIRPRIFLEGNFFVDLKPGTPSAPKFGNGDTITVTNTATPVQLDQVLTALQDPTREDLRTILHELGTGLERGAPSFNKAYEDATMLLRPKTGLKDMTVELDPGTRAAGALKENATIPVAQTQPDVNLDELLSALDGDTRSYLTVLLNNGAQGLEGRGRDLGDTIRTFRPTARALERINGALAKRRENIRRVMHNFSLVADLGDHDEELARFVNANGAVLRVLAQQEADIRATIRQLRPALRETRAGLQKTGALADQLGPAFNALLPGARALGPTQRALRPFFRETTPIIRDSVRPLVRATRPVIAELRPTIRSLSEGTDDLFSTLESVNTLVDVLAYNPPGDEEGYLFWLSWPTTWAPTSSTRRTRTGRSAAARS